MTRQVDSHGYVVEREARRTNKLLVRPTPFPDEHAIGYQLRLAHVNGLANPAWLARSSAGGKSARYLGRNRWCPLCLDEEKPYWRQSWTMSVGVCWTHQCWLIDICPGCDTRMTWQKARFLTCRCGHPLSKAPPTLFAKELADLLPEITQSSASDVTWSSLDIEGRWNVARFLGALQIYGLQGKPLKKVSKMDARVEREVVTAGACILLMGGDGFHRLLDRLRMPSSRGTTAQLINEAFPGLLTRLRRNLALQEQEILLPHIRSYVNRSTSSTVAVVWREGTSPHAGSTHRCAVTLGIRHDRVGTLFKQQGIFPKTRISPAGRTMLTVDAEDLRRVRNALSTALSKREASRIFGISPARQEELIKLTLLTALGRKVDRASLERLLSKISAGCSKGKCDNGQELISLGEALRTLVPRPFTAPFFNALLTKRIDVFRSTQKARPVDSLQLSRTQIIGLLAEEKASKSDYIAIPEAACSLGLKQEVLYHLVNQGMIEVKYRRVGRRVARFIARLELDRFVNEIEPLAQVARRFGVGTKFALEWAQSQGMAVVSGPGIDGGRQYFVRRYAIL